MNVIDKAKNRFEDVFQGTLTSNWKGGKAEKDPIATKMETEPRSEVQPLGEALDSLIHGNEIVPAQIIVEYDLSVDQFILELLRHVGGNLKQQEIVNYTGWSASKISRDLSRLEAEGSVGRFQLGREKVVHIPGAGPG